MNRHLDISRIEPLREYLTDLRNGDTITVTDEGAPVAAIVAADPTEELTWRRATGRLADYKQLPPLRTDIDIVDLLLEERSDR